MKDLARIAVIVQARKNSERVPQKMIRDFGGTTLLDITLKKLMSSKVISKNNIWLSVHESELIEIGTKHGVNIFHRTAASANSEGEEMTEIYEWWDRLPFYDYVVLVNACAPFMKLETVEEFVQFYTELADDDVGAFGVIPKKNYFWNEEQEALVKLDPRFKVMNTKSVATTYEAAHCLYASKMSKVGEGFWMGDFNKHGDIALFPMKEEETFDIDYEWQFERALKIYEGTNEQT